MRQLKYAGHLLLPSPGSTALVLILTITILGLANWAYGEKSGLLYEYLLGPNSAPDLIENSKSTLAAIKETVFNNSLLNRVLFFAFWLLIGIVVYILATGIGKYAGEVIDYWQQRNFVHNNRERATRQFGTRALVHAAALLLLFLYGVLLVRIFIPFGILASQIGFSRLSEPAGWLYSLLAAVELILSLHVLVVFLRLAALRPRLFGGIGAAE